MAILNILREGEETLRKKSRPVEVINPRVLRLLDDMKDTLKKAEGVGLAAPQVGVLRRIFVVDTGERTVEFINPVIVQEEGVQVGTEGCLGDGDVGARVEVVPVALEVLVWLDADRRDEVARRSAVQARLAMALHANLLPVADALGYFDGEVCAVRDAALALALGARLVDDVGVQTSS